MRLLSRIIETTGLARVAFFVLACVFSPEALGGEVVVVHLRNGDSVSGTLLSESPTMLVLSNAWTRELSIPVSEIVVAERLPQAAVAQSPPAPSLPPNTNVPVVITVPPPSKPKPKSKPWTIEARLGLDLLYGAKDREIYYGRFKLTYLVPLASNPARKFRHVLDYTAGYAKTDGILSANNMYGSSQLNLDIAPRFFLYNLGGVGYDTIRKIDLGYDVGPGVGYRLITQQNVQVNLESGINWQVQDRIDSPDTESLFYRLAHDCTWKIFPRLTFSEKLAGSVSLEGPEEYRAIFDATLSYTLIQNLTLNASVLDTYDSSPAPGVDKNEFQVRSSLGITF